jgi:hypothetical protein
MTALASFNKKSAEVLKVLSQEQFNFFSQYFSNYKVKKNVNTITGPTNSTDLKI